MYLKIIAVADTPAPDNRLRWKASIQAETKPIKADLELIDPLTQDEKSDCCWYLEKHTRDPFRVLRAANAASSIERYRQSLAEQLQLGDIQVADATAGTAFTAQGTINLKNAPYTWDKGPIEAGCTCAACRQFTRGYLRHLLKAEEILGLLVALNPTVGNVRIVSAAAEIAFALGIDLDTDES